MALGLHGQHSNHRLNALEPHLDRIWTTFELHSNRLNYACMTFERHVNCEDYTWAALVLQFNYILITLGLHLGHT
eukprot:766620-Pyramimonas_sp.AAC.1